jgi:hypothetical protein
MRVRGGITETGVVVLVAVLGNDLGRLFAWVMDKINCVTKAMNMNTNEVRSSSIACFTTATTVRCRSTETC